jgi:cyclic pyranopterin phosphate synthase
MRYEEIITVVKAATKIGVKNIRLTGGEPLVRPGIVDFVSMLREIDEIEDISMTTNGYLLSKNAKALKDAGLNRVNVSLDTLDPQLFKKITRIGELEKVWQGIMAAEEAGLSPVKINAVVVRGINDNEIVDFALLTRKYNWHVRFIELMPVNNQKPWGPGFPDPSVSYFSTHEMIEKLKDLNLEIADEWIGNGPAKLYKIDGGKGLVGFISPLDEEHFCQRCNRLRLTADGFLRPCLMSDVEIPLMHAIRSGEEIDSLIQETIQLKPMRHELLLNHRPKSRTMQQIGG